jgi:hypothetical protein
MTISRPMLSRRQWCGMVGLLCAPTMADDATEALIRMLPALQHFPDYLFTEETAQAVAEGKRRLACPDFAEIKAALNAYRKEFIYEPRPAIAPPPEPARKGPTQAEMEAVAASVAEALRGIAQSHAERVAKEAELGRPQTPLLRDVQAQGQALGDLRRARFADLVQRGKMRPEEVPEAYRPGESRS